MQITAALEDYPALVACSNLSGFTPWHYAARNGFEQLLRILVRATVNHEALIASKQAQRSQSTPESAEPANQPRESK